MKKTLGLLLLLAVTAAGAEEVEVIEITSEPPAAVAPDVVAESTINAAPVRSVNSQTKPVLAAKPTGTLEQRLSRLERQFANSAEADLPTQLNQLRQELQALRGEQEVQAHNLKQLQEQLKAQYQDLEARLAKMAAVALENKVAAKAPSVAETQPAAVIPVGAKDKKTEPNSARHATKTTSATSTSGGANKSVSAEANLADEEKAYQAGYDLLKAKKYDAAKAKLQALVKTYPQSNYAGSAHYWLGEIALLQGHQDDSIKEFNKVIKDNKSNQTKLPEAMLKLGFAYYDKGQWAQAREQLLRVKQRFPGSSVAQMAEVRLQELKEQGH